MTRMRSLSVNEDVGDVVLSTAQREVVMVLRGERKDRVA